MKSNARKASLAPPGADGRDEDAYQRGGLAVRLETSNQAADDFLGEEHELVLGGRGLPTPATRITGRPAVVVGAADHTRLQAIAPFVRERGPVVIAVGRAADDLLGLHWAPDVVVVTAGDPGSVPSTDALRLATDVVVVAEPGARAEVAGVSEDALVVETSATGEDVALLLAGHGDASLVVGVGLHTPLGHYLDGDLAGRGSSFATRLVVGERLVDSSVVRALYTGRPEPLQLFAVILAGLVALLAAVAVTPVGQEWGNRLIHYLGGLL